jgi:M6 family metalloprotease-like protein
MKSLFTILLSVLIIVLGIEMKPAPFDTGMITLQQPDRTAFTGRIWGDEFFYWAETEDGYRFVQSGDEWYYYAQLDEYGEFTATEYKVGIDEPPSESYQLERTQARIDDINQQIEDFIEQVELNRQWFAQKQAEAQGQPVTLKVGLILIEFQDVKHYRDTIPPTVRPDGYTTADFDSMMFSHNYWIGGINNPKHPEGERIFGSFRDYWDQMSMGKLKITGKVVNPDNDEDGVPDWLEASGNRSHYIDTVGGHILALEAYDSALAKRYISEEPSDSNYYDNYAVVYAREAINGRIAVGGAQGGRIIHLAERSGPNLFGGGPLEKSFTHIGTYLHEFGHNLGFYDEYNPQTLGSTDINYFCLMSYGSYNGPDRKGACPATLSPYYRIDKEWISSIPINQDTSNFIIQYSYTDSIIYHIDPVNAINDEHYVIETKNRVGFDSYIPGPPSDTTNQPGRLIIWQHNTNSNYPSSYYDRIRIKHADNDTTVNTQINDFFPAFFSMNNYQSFNDTTSPAATINETWPQLNILGKPAHFAINGIHKLENGNTLIDEIKLNHAIIKNNISGGWQSVSIGAILSDYSATSVFPTAIGQVYAYVPGQGYVVKTILENGPGYWAKFGSAQSLAHSGLILDSISIRVSRGWNLIGSISDKVPKLSICTEPPGIITSMYYYDGGYHYLTNSDSLKPGRGYWLNSTSNGNVLLLRNFQCPENEGMDLAGFDKFKITDSEGRTQDLYVANVDIDTALVEFDRSLPPPIPEIDFDARFNYGEFIKAVSVDSGEVDLEIDVQTNAYPITLSWEINPANGIEYSFISDSGIGKISSINLTNSKLTIGESSQGKIKLFGKVSNSSIYNIPEKFELLQNYPNPFNPSTVIEFSLPEDVSNVKLSIYNALGEKVAELVNSSLTAGKYQYQWNASNVATGMYIYELRTDKFVSVKKMMLIR